MNYSSEGCGGGDVPQVLTVPGMILVARKITHPAGWFSSFYFLFSTSSVLTVGFLQGETSTLIISTSTTKIVAVGNISSRSFEDIFEIFSRSFRDLSKDASVGVCMHPARCRKKRLGNSLEGVWYHAIPCHHAMRLITRVLHGNTLRGDLLDARGMVRVVHTSSRTRYNPHAWLVVGSW